MSAEIATRCVPQAEPGSLLANCPVLSNLEDRDLECLLEGAEVLRVETGETVFRRGDPGDTVLLVRAGSVVVEADRRGGGSVVVNVIEPGEIFGEMAVIDGTTRSATVTACEPCELLVIPQPEFLALLVNHPGLGIRMLGAVAKRLRCLTDRAGDLGA
jgi:CRP-like cAMP-binding protein